MLASTSNNELKIWNFINNTSNNEVITNTTLLPNLTNICWNHTNQVVAISNSICNVQLVHSLSGQLLSTIPFEPPSINNNNNNNINSSISFSSNSRHIAQSINSKILIYDLKKRNIRNELIGHYSSVTSLSFLSDGRIISSDTIGSIYIWDLKTNDNSYQAFPTSSSSTVPTTTNDASITCIRSNLTGTPRLAAADINGCITVYDITTMKLLRRQGVHKSPISSLAFSPKNSRLIASCRYTYLKCVHIYTIYTFIIILYYNTSYT